MRSAIVRTVLALVAFVGTPDAALPQLVDGCPTHTYLGNLPSDAEPPDWSEQAQGIANDGEHWFFTNVSHLFKYDTNWRHRDGDDTGKLEGVDIPSVLADLGIDHFGASAPAEVIAEQFGFTPDAVAAKVKAHVSR